MLSVYDAMKLEELVKNYCEENHLTSVFSIRVYGTDVSFESDSEIEELQEQVRDLQDQVDYLDSEREDLKERLENALDELESI